MDNPILISALLALVVALLAYMFLMPRNQDVFSPDNEEQSEDNMLLKIMTKISGELYATLPANSVKSGKRTTNPRIESLLIRSGNPWGLKAQEFVFFQYSAALIGFALGWLINVPLSQMGVHWGVTVAFTTIFSYFLPKLKYTDEAKKRDLEFRRHLPEALDLLIISLSSGSTFNQAVRDSVPNMPEGVLKEEFREMARAVDNGKTTSAALDSFASRAPNESISTFIKAVQEATSLNVPLVEVLESRAEASRSEFFSLIHNKTAALPSKMMGVLTPTLIPAIMIIVLAPAIMSLVSTLGA